MSELAENSPEDEPAAFFIAEGDTYRSTILTRGPWDDRFQHGGRFQNLPGPAGNVHHGFENGRFRAGIQRDLHRVRTDQL